MRLIGHYDLITPVISCQLQEQDTSLGVDKL